MQISLIKLTSLVLLAGLTANAMAQGSVADRRIGAVGVLPDAAGGHVVHAVWTVGLSAPSSQTLDLSSEAFLFVNGSQVAQLGTSVLADGGAGDCFSCTGGCGGGYIDGVFNTLLCLEDSVGPMVGCDCRFPWITSSFPPVPLQPGDEIMVLLRPSPGATPDLDPTTDEFVLAFGGAPIRWDREIVDIGIEPGGTALLPHFTTLDIDYGYDPALGELDLTSVVEVSLNGAIKYVYESPCGPWIASPGSSCGICDGALCGKITCNGHTIVEMRCQLDPDSGHCGCTSINTQSLELPPVQLQPGDILKVKLVPTPGALPELPGFEEDELEVGRWLDLGQALAGKYGDPQLVGEGSLIGGDPVSFALGNALELSTAYFVIGLSELGAAFKGGVMVPNVDLFVALPTGAAGSLNLALAWPLGLPSGFSSFYQCWIVDDAGPVGFSASNALAATTP